MFPGRNPRLTLPHPIEKNAEFFLCPCEAEPEHPGAELTSYQENSHPNSAPSVLAMLFPSYAGRSLWARLIRETPPWIESRTCSVSFSCIRLSMWLLTNSLELRSKVCSCSIPAMLLTACPCMPGCILINWEQSACLHWASCAKDCAWDHLVITCF